MPSEGSSDPGDLLGVVVRHVEEMMLGAFVFDCRPKGLSIASYIEPIPSSIGGGASERLPLFVGLSHVFVKEVLAQSSAGKAVGGGHAGGKAVDRLIEGDARMGRAVREMEPDTRVALEKV